MTSDEKAQQWHASLRLLKRITLKRFSDTFKLTVLSGRYYHETKAFNWPLSESELVLKLQELAHKGYEQA